MGKRIKPLEKEKKKKVCYYKFFIIVRNRVDLYSLTSTQPELDTQT
jgi:hypothetical protein